MKIKNIKIRNVKAHVSLDLKLNNKNLLLFGDNGSGKSSIYEALKIAFFQFNANQIGDLKNKSHIADDLSVEIEMDNGKIIKNTNGTTQSNIGKTNVFCIDMLKCDDSATIDVCEVIKHHFFLSSRNNTFEFYSKTSFNGKSTAEKLLAYQMHDDYLLTFLKRLEKKANNILNKFFYENFSLTIDFSGTHINSLTDEFVFPKAIVQVTDLDRNIQNEPRIHLLLNEAKVKLVFLSVYFAYIKLAEGKLPKYLILDDFITSLDMSNRTFVAQYILEQFQSYQIILLTHNIHFFTLFEFLQKEVVEVDSNWLSGHLYHYHDGQTMVSHLNIGSGNVTVQDLKKIFQSIKHDPVLLKDFGNQIRKKFEKLIFNYQKFYHLGKQEEIEVILTQIVNNKPIYIQQNQMVDDIRKESTARNIKKIINDQRYFPSELSNIMRNAKFFRKIVMNPSSHYDTESMVVFKEYEQTLEVLGELESLIVALIKPKK